jgi:hypothetical protein
MEPDSLCKKLGEDAQKLREQKTMLEGMVESHDELIMDFADKYGYNHSDEDTDDEDDDDRGDATAPLLLHYPLYLCHLLLPLRWLSSKRKAPWRWFLSRRPLRCMSLPW